MIETVAVGRGTLAFNCDGGPVAGERYADIEEVGEPSGIRLPVGPQRVIGVDNGHDRKKVRQLGYPSSKTPTLAVFPDAAIFLTGRRSAGGWAGSQGP